MEKVSSSQFLRAALCGVGAAGIWAGWIVAGRHGVQTSLTPWGIAALRYGVGGLLLLPYVLRKGLAIERLGGIGFAAIVIGCGAPMVLLVNAGLLLAPAAHAGGLFSGMVPLIAALMAIPLLGEKFTAAKAAGIALILLGAIGIVWSTGATFGTAQTVGHLLFIAGAILWAGYTIAMRKARLDGLHAAGIAAVGSLILYLPVYIALAGGRLLQVPLGELLLQGFVHGVLTAVVSLVLFGNAVRILGASGGAAFVALAPVMTALIGIPALGEWPSTGEWLAILTIATGVYALTGAPLPKVGFGWARERTSR